MSMYLIPKFQALADFNEFVRKCRQRREFTLSVVGPPERLALAVTCQDATLRALLIGYFELARTDIPAFTDTFEVSLSNQQAKDLAVDILAVRGSLDVCSLDCPKQLQHYADIPAEDQPVLARKLQRHRRGLEVISRSKNLPADVRAAVTEAVRVVRKAEAASLITINIEKDDV